jgi:hypothetical protein
MDSIARGVVTYESLVDGQGCANAVFNLDNQAEEGDNADEDRRSGVWRSGGRWFGGRW